MKFNTKRAIAVCSYVFGIVGAAWGLGYLMGSDDGFEEGKNRMFDALTSPDPEEDEEPDHGRFEWADGGEEAFVEALEEADKEEEVEE